ncbi:Protein required for attachment to host cells [Sphingomonas sp. YR710]|jgi:protein required for attachment to host cells|uniref:host attachment family protein n=1 Tax=Sphingomonas sp. YR710 TaxID=1882773 RepID=UPI00087E3951|nr:host attachment family protein [Sphingomonas sp. YR710]SDC10832.1 Protein required for attachment to host cells [Sphingomonas sp. YR710]
MRIAHDVLVVVADGRKSLFLRNEGDAEFPHFIVESHRSHEDLPDRDLKSDAPTVAVSSVGGRRSTVEETDYHQQAEDRFAADSAALLGRKAQDGEFAKLIIVAPPRTLGELRRHYTNEVSSRILVEVDKDLVNHPINRIEEALKAL